MSNQVYSTGRRKESIAKVWVSNGKGKIIINEKNIEDSLRFLHALLIRFFMDLDLFVKFFELSIVEQKFSATARAVVKPGAKCILFNIHINNK